MQAVGAGCPLGNSWSERKGQAAEEAQSLLYSRGPQGSPVAFSQGPVLSADPASFPGPELLWLDPGQGGCGRCPAKSHPPGSVPGGHLLPVLPTSPRGALARCQRLGPGQQGSGRLGASPPGMGVLQPLVRPPPEHRGAASEGRDQASPTSSFPEMKASTSHPPPQKEN